jgi:hypothetical protein
VDWDVEPAVPMYYKFAVVQTDMAESDPSNIASAAAVDTVPPEITHTPKTSAPPSAGVRLTAEVTDNVAVEGVAVHYRPRDTSEPYVSLPASNISGDNWTITIPGAAVQPPGIEYYLTATDGITQVYHGTAAAPHTVIVVAAPSLTSVSPNQGSVDGGTRVTLTGSMFQDGALVEFGGVAATDVVVQTSGQILCTTPPHFPDSVDVRVVNPDSSEATLLSGFRYLDQDAVVSLPVLTADHGDIFDIPASVSNVDGLLAAGLTITFDASVLQVRDVRTGTLTSNWTLVENTNTPGQVTLSLAGTAPASGSGTLANVSVEAVGPAASQTALNLDDVLFNDGAIAPDLSNGHFAVNGFFTLSGSAAYYHQNRPVPGVGLDLVGVGVHTTATDATGQYSIPDVQTGAYTLTPNKEDQVQDITAFDASLVLQATSGLLTLSDNQRLAADVNRNGEVTPLDASHILRKSVDLVPGMFPGSGRYWDFVPAERNYPHLNGDLANQNFTAVLIGDVSGNWGASGGEAPARDGQAAAAPADISLAIPRLIGQTGDVIRVPVEIGLAGADVYASDLVIAYDAGQLEVREVTSGEAVAGSAWAANIGEPGLIRVGVAGARPLAEGGSLIEVAFEVTGALEEATHLSFLGASVNEGGVGVSLQHGWVADVLAVTELTPTASGFVAELSRPVEPAALNLYTVESGALGSADVSLVGATVGPVAGSLVLRGQSLTFLATGGPLPADEYTVRYRSAANGFHRPASGQLLDGDFDGVPGTDCVRNLLLPGPQDPVVQLPDFTRGPGQAVHLPGNTLEGIPLSVTNTDGITTLDLTIGFDDTLLGITGAELGPDAPADAALIVDASQTGQLVLQFTSPTALPAGRADLVTIAAEVPDTAPSGAAHVLDLSDLVVNGGSIPATADDALHSVAYFGDTTGNGDYSGLDAVQIARVVVGLDGGYEALPFIDPVIIADITGNGDLSGLDAVLIAREVVGLDPPEIPPLPSGQEPGAAFDASRSAGELDARTVDELFGSVAHSALAPDFWRDAAADLLQPIPRLRSPYAP